MSEEELEKMDKEELLGIIKAQRFEISILKDDKEHLGEFLKEKEDEIERLKNDIKRITEITNQKINIINEVREYIENNSLYEQDYDYDYEENLYECPPSDEQARKDILSILDKGE